MTASYASGSLPQMLDGHSDRADAGAAQSEQQSTTDPWELFREDVTARQSNVMVRPGPGWCCSAC
jgi:hypothetical protein